MFSSVYLATQQFRNVGMNKFLIGEYNICEHNGFFKYSIFQKKFQAYRNDVGNVYKQFKLKVERKHGLQTVSLYKSQTENWFRELFSQSKPEPGMRTLLLR